MFTTDEKCYIAPEVTDEDIRYYNSLECDTLDEILSQNQTYTGLVFAFPSFDYSTRCADPVVPDVPLDPLVTFN